MISHSTPGNNETPSHQATLDLCSFASDVKRVSLEHYVHTFCKGITNATQQQISAAVTQHRNLLARNNSGFSVKQEVGHTFPDGAHFEANYFKFCSGLNIFGLASIYLGFIDGCQIKGQRSDRKGNLTIVNHQAPCCLIHLIQGAPRADIINARSWAQESFQPIDLRSNGPYMNSRHFMLDFVISCSQEMLASGWRLALLDTPENRKLREPFFEKEPCFNFEKPTFLSACERFYPKMTKLFLLKSPGRSKPLRKLLAEGIKFDAQDAS